MSISDKRGTSSACAEPALHAAPPSEYVYVFSVLSAGGAAKVQVVEGLFINPV